MLRPIIIAALAATGLSSCSPYDAQSASVRDRTALDRELAGRVAGPSRSCLPSFRTGDFAGAHAGALLFRDGATTYVTQTGGGCERLNDLGYTLVTESFGGGLCRGSLARVVDLRSGAVVGSCVMGDFTPYRRPR